MCSPSMFPRNKLLPILLRDSIPANLNLHNCGNLYLLYFEVVQMYRNIRKGGQHFNIVGLKLDTNQRWYRLFALKYQISLKSVNQDS